MDHVVFFFFSLLFSFLLSIIFFSCCHVLYSVYYVDMTSLMIAIYASLQL